MSKSWYKIENVAEVDSPALVVYPDRIAENIRRMIAIAGGPVRLRPHIKTHKMSAIVRMQVEAGIDKCKCATLAEAEMAAGAGATDVLLAHQPVGPKVAKLAALARRFPERGFRRSSMIRESQPPCQRPVATRDAASICCSISISAWGGVVSDRARRQPHFIASSRDAEHQSRRAARLRWPSSSARCGRTRGVPSRRR